jgi:hypothetical protein
MRRCRTGVEVDVATEQEEYAEEKVRETMRGIFLGWRSRRGSEMADKGEGWGRAVGEEEVRYLVKRRTNRWGWKRLIEGQER